MDAERLVRLEADISYIKQHVQRINEHIGRLYAMERDLMSFKSRVYGGTATILGLGAIVSTVTKIIGVW
jgi:hypothetical protein